MKQFVRFLALMVALSLFLPSAVLADSSTKAKTLVPLVGDLLEDLFDDYEIKYNETLFNVYVSTEGLASKLQAAYDEGHDVNWEPWVEYKDSILATHQSIMDLLASYGRTDISVDLWVLNDDAEAGKDTRFISYLAYASEYGIMYDAMYRTPLPDNMATEPIVDPSTFADQSSIEAIQATFAYAFKEAEFDYFYITYNEDGQKFYIETAIDGFVDTLISAKKAGYDETWEDWVYAKDVFSLMFDACELHLKSVGRDDLKIYLVLENDDIVLRGDYGTIDYSPLLSIGVFGTVVNDVMED